MKLRSVKEAIEIGLKDYLGHYKQAVKSFWQFDTVINGLPVEYFFIAQAVQESRFHSEAVSPVGALGIAQFMPQTAREVGAGLSRHYLFKNGFEPKNSIQSVYAQVFYMNNLCKSWKLERTTFQRFELALASYNAGLGNIIKAQKISGDKRNWEDIKGSLVKVTGKYSNETLGYINNIIGYSNIMKDMQKIDF
ncbi:transglycosylase [Aliarcobacter faecis]|uniref:transglycosylase SLT domain-containing protein n=1 Tax=Aliarcobacter faecis TaxID=1564138 RepID=UPI0004B21276|nr:transglycosylase SLT domain-containing protein [Aliarcobacter faecis]QKF72800.1 transglycosylase [Aliarcobacter faecis]